MQRCAWAEKRPVLAQAKAWPAWPKTTVQLSPMLLDWLVTSNKGFSSDEDRQCDRRTQGIETTAYITLAQDVSFRQKCLKA